MRAYSGALGGATAYPEKLIRYQTFILLRDFPLLYCKDPYLKMVLFDESRQQIRVVFHRIVKTVVTINITAFEAVPPVTGASGSPVFKSLGSGGCNGAFGQFASNSASKTEEFVIGFIRPTSTTGISIPTGLFVEIICNVASNNLTIENT